MMKKSYRFENKLLLDTKWFSNKFRAVVDKFVTKLQYRYKKIIFYSLFPGGKRIRPLLMFATGEMLDIERYKLLYPACSVELIHNYSLIHDDLPSMDNDDYRRGKLTVHKKFGEANAILTGDGLLTLAFEVLSGWKYVDTEVGIKIINLLSNYVGFEGLIKGQLMDLDSRRFLNRTPNKQVKNYLQELVLNKTAKLIQISVLIPGIVKKLTKHKFKSLAKVGLNIGMLFQITDDVIDYKSGQDVTNLSYPRVYGMEQTYRFIEDLMNETIVILNQTFGVQQSEYLKFLIRKIACRTE